MTSEQSYWPKQRWTPKYFDKFYTFPFFKLYIVAMYFLQNKFVLCFKQRAIYICNCFYTDYLYNNFTLFQIFQHAHGLCQEPLKYMDFRASCPPASIPQGRAIIHPPVKHLYPSPWRNIPDPSMQSIKYTVCKWMYVCLSQRVLKEGEIFRNVPLSTGAWCSVPCGTGLLCACTLTMWIESFKLEFWF